MNITGLDGATGIPVGATLTAATWHIAGHYGPGAAHDTEVDAIRAGIAEHEALIARHLEFHGVTTTEHLERFSIDLRWTWRWNADPERGGASGYDSTVRRTTYQTLAEAHEHVARIEKYAGPSGSHTALTPQQISVDAISADRITRMLPDVVLDMGPEETQGEHE